jgi:single-stranded-DNA-specific exonuclease
VSLARDAGVPLVIARLLLARGITTAEAAQRFLSPSLDQLHSPYLMLGMTEAVTRIEKAIANKERTLIYGDYDVDGTTAVVILKTAIELCGGTVHFHVPHRLREGYGMRDDVIERAHESGVRLIISVDTGIRAFAAAETCHRLGLDLIVTDHHLPQAEGVPVATAVLNPNQQGCEYPCKALCGAGVAFKVAQALLEKTGRARLIPSFLKMVAIATIADAVPLTGENRVFAKLGLDGLRMPVNAGLKALMDVAELTSGRGLTVTDVAFRLAPRLNAAGRMDVARDVVDLFTLRDGNVVRELAERLNRLNIERQQEEARIMAEIHGRVEREPELRDAWCIVVDGEGWHKGVIGIAAARVVDRWNRPALVITREGDQAQGSGRSIEAFHLLDALESCAPLFTRFGGHAFAAGFALPVERIPELRQSLDQRARAMLTIDDLQPVITYDGDLDLNDVTPQLFRELQRMEPFGMGNPEPKFAARGALLTQPPKLLKDRHAKLFMSAAQPKQNGNGTSYRRSFAAMGWRLAERATNDALTQGDALDVIYSITENLHPDFGGIELCLHDYAKAERTAVAATVDGTAH